MAMTTHINIVSAEEEIYSGTAEMIFAPAVMGEVGIAPRHTPMLTPRLKRAKCVCRQPGRKNSSSMCRVACLRCDRML